jgi:hypothetical protein
MLYFIYSQYIFISISWYKAKPNQYRLAIRAYSNRWLMWIMMKCSVGLQDIGISSRILSYLLIKVKNLQWRACLNCLPTRLRLQSRGAPSQGSCADVWFTTDIVSTFSLNVTKVLLVGNVFILYPLFSLLLIILLVALICVFGMMRVVLC